MLAGVINDGVTKYLTIGLSAYQICFFRFGFGSLVLIPLVLYHGGITVLQTKRLFLHCMRGLFLAVGMCLYSYSLTQVSMSTVTVIGFANPIFTLPLARLFLKEQVGWPIWAATVCAFIGIIIIVHPTITMVNLNAPVFACLLAAVVFASLDIINKNYIAREPMLSMLFFSNLMAGFCIAPGAAYYWQMPTLFQLFILGILGMGSNLILYCLLKAFTLSNASALAPIKYIELVLSSLFGYLFFNEWPTLHTCLGAILIIGSTCFISYCQNRS